MKEGFIDIVFDGPPGHESGRFVEVEDATGKGISAGEWVQREDGYWVLRISPKVFAEVQALVGALEKLLNRRHLHVAGEKDIDECGKCGHDIRNSDYHFRMGESEKTDIAEAYRLIGLLKDKQP